jgi:hypothetical protein
MSRQETDRTIHLSFYFCHSPARQSCPLSSSSLALERLSLKDMSAMSVDDASTITAPSQSSIKREVDAMYRVIKGERNNKEKAIIAVVRPESLVTLEGRCRTSWWKFWTGELHLRRFCTHRFQTLCLRSSLLDTGKSLVLVTTDDWLQETIATLQDYPQFKNLIILVTAEVDAISFRVHFRFKTLTILRGGHRDGQLLINGASTFHKVRLDGWQEKGRKQRLYLGPGVKIQVSFSRNSSWANSGNNLSASQRQELRQHLQGMRETTMNGKWWHQWKGPIATILALVTGTGKLAIGLKAAAGGVYVNFQLGAMTLKVGAAAMKASAIATAAGPAILLGAGVAVAVYFIPWDDVFVWLKDVLSCFLDWISALWASFRSWLGRQMQNNHTDESSGRGSIPMGFS